MPQSTWVVEITCTRCKHVFKKSDKWIRFAPGIRRNPPSDFFVFCPNCQVEISIPSAQIPQNIRHAAMKRRYAKARFSTL